MREEKEKCNLRADRLLYTTLFQYDLSIRGKSLILPEMPS